MRAPGYPKHDGVVGNTGVADAAHLQRIEKLRERRIIGRGAEAARIVDGNHAAGRTALQDEIDLCANRRFDFAFASSRAGIMSVQIE